MSPGREASTSRSEGARADRAASFRVERFARRPTEPLLALGAEGVSEPLPAGTFVLEAVHPDGRVARAQVELVEGRTTDMVLALDWRNPHRAAAIPGSVARGELGQVVTEADRTPSCEIVEHRNDPSARRQGRAWAYSGPPLVHPLELSIR